MAQGALDGVTLAFDGVTLAALAVATVTDLRRREVPNWLTYPAFAFGLGANTALLGSGALGQALFAVLFVLLVLGLPCWLGGIGAGDLKLMLAVAALERTPLIYSALV